MKIVISENPTSNLTSQLRRLIQADTLSINSPSTLIKLVTQSNPELVFIDLDSTQKRTIEELRRLGYNGFICAFGNEDNPIELVDRYLTKPITQAELKDVLESYHYNSRLDLITY